MSESDSGELESFPTTTGQFADHHDRGIDGVDLTRFQFDLLAAMASIEEPLHDGVSGQDIKRAVGAVYGEEIGHGRLYPNLDTLVEKGLIEKGQIDRRTNSYEVTDEGVALLEQRARMLGHAVGATAFEFVGDDASAGGL